MNLTLHSGSKVIVLLCWSPLYSVCPFKGVAFMLFSFHFGYRLMCSQFDLDCMVCGKYSIFKHCTYKSVSKFFVTYNLKPTIQLCQTSPICHMDNKFSCHAVKVLFSLHLAVTTSSVLHICLILQGDLQSPHQICTHVASCRCSYTMIMIGLGSLKVISIATTVCSVRSTLNYANTSSKIHMYLRVMFHQNLIIKLKRHAILKRVNYLLR